MKLNIKQTILVGFAYLAINAFWQMHGNLIPKILTETFHIGESISGVLMAVCAILYFLESKKEKASKAGSVMYYAAAVLGLVGVGATVWCSNISADNALMSLTMCIAVGVIGAVLSVGAAILAPKNDLLRTVAGVASIASFMVVVSNLISERVMLVAGLFSFNAGNEIGWQVFYATIVAAVALLLACVAVIVGNFAKGKAAEEQAA